MSAMVYQVSFFNPVLIQAIHSGSGTYK